MALESLTGTSVFIDDLINTNPAAGDSKGEGDDHIRGIKNVLLNTFPGLTGAVTATQAELNNLDGYTGNTSDLNLLAGLVAAGLTTTELGYVNGVTSAIQAQIDTKYGAGGTDIPITDGGTGASDAASARTNLGLAALSLLDTVDENTIDDLSIGSNKLVSTVSSVTTANPIATGATESVTADGLLNIHVYGSGPDIAVELLINSLWRQVTVSSNDATGVACTVFSTGSNVRISHGGGAGTGYYTIEQMSDT